MAFQDTFLFHASLADNLRYARPNASDDELVAAARVAHLHDIVASLPEEYDTLVTKRGHRLSTVLAADQIVELDRLGHGERRPRRERG